MKNHASLGATFASLLVLSLAHGCANAGAGGGFDNADADGGATFAAVTDAGDPSDAPFQGCATATARARRAPVFLELVIDASGSMKGAKWSALVAALDGIYDRMLAEKDPTQGVGMLVFSDTRDKTIGTGPYPVTDADDVTKLNDIPIGFVDQARHDALRRRIDPPTNASLLTPTLAALTGGFSVLEGFTPAPPLPAEGKKVLVLMTDGMPSDDGNDESHPLVAREYAAAAPRGPIATFPVAIGDFTDIDPPWIGSLAVAGGTARAGCNPKEASNPAKLCYFQIVPNGKSVADLTQEFTATLDRIRIEAVACELTLPAGGAKADPTHVNVVLDDGTGKKTVVPRDDTNGWTYDDPNDPTKVLLHGTACTTAATNLAASVEVVLGCLTLTK
jgi:hypothetical protein